MFLRQNKELSYQNLPLSNKRFLSEGRGAREKYENKDYYFSRIMVVLNEVKIILIGSITYNKSRKNYILYVASKGILNSMVGSAKVLLLKTNIEYI